MKLTIYASDLAACIGMHRYQQPWEAAVRIFERTSPSHYQAAHARVGREIPASMASRTLKRIQESDVVTEVENLIQGSVDKLDDKVQKVIDEIGASDPEFAGDLRTYVFTERGKVGEKAAVDAFELSHNVSLTERNTKFFKKTFSCDGKVVILGGRVDGLSDDGRLVEIKNRQRRFFNSVPLYEKVQVLAYMVLTGSPQCELVERFDNEFKVTVVPFDETLWDKIVFEMLNFSKKMFILFNDESVQDSLIRDKSF